MCTQTYRPDVFIVYLMSSHWDTGQNGSTNTRTTKRKLEKVQWVFGCFFGLGSTQSLISQVKSSLRGQTLIRKLGQPPTLIMCTMYAKGSRHTHTRMQTHTQEQGWVTWYSKMAVGRPLPFQLLTHNDHEQHSLHTWSLYCHFLIQYYWVVGDVFRSLIKILIPHCENTLLQVLYIQVCKYYQKIKVKCSRKISVLF